MGDCPWMAARIARVMPWRSGPDCRPAPTDLACRAETEEPFRSERPHIVPFRHRPYTRTARIDTPAIRSWYGVATVRSAESQVTWPGSMVTPAALTFRGRASVGGSPPTLA